MTEYSASGAEVIIKQEASEEIEEICRLCVARSISFFSVFSENLPELLATHLGVSISESDNWPKFVCSRCMEKVHDVVRFITTIRESENILRDLFGERENTPRIVNVLSGEQCISIKEEVDKSPTNQDTGILRQMLLGDISKCSYITQKLPLPPPSTSLLRDQLLKPHSSRPTCTLRPFYNIVPVKRRRRRRTLAPEEVEATLARIEEFYKIQCDICMDIFTKFRDLEDHFRDIHNRKAYIKCCRLKFSGLINLNEHIQYHADPETFRCHECGKCFKYQCSLDFHTLNTHTPHEMRKFPCNFCPQRFVTAKMLRQHAIVHVDSDEKKLNCPHCQRTFERTYSMKKHIRTFHEGGANIICQVCGILFRDTQTLKRHQSTHTKQQSASCEICGKNFRHKYNLTSHMRLHLSSDETYECHFCSKKFDQKYAIRSHINYVHLKKKTHKCPMCQSAYKTFPELKQHIAMHTGELNFQCRFCDRMFVTRSQRFAHEKNLHPADYEAIVGEKRIEKTTSAIQLIKEESNDCL